MAPNRQRRAKAKPALKRPKPSVKRPKSAIKRPKPKRLNCPFSKISNCTYKGHIDGQVFRLHLWQHYKEKWNNRVNFLVTREDNLYHVYCDKCPHDSTGVTPDGAMAIAICHLALRHHELRGILDEDERLSEDFVNDVYYDVDLIEAKRNPSGLPKAISAEEYLLKQIYGWGKYCESYEEFAKRYPEEGTKVSSKNENNGCLEIQWELFNENLLEDDESDYRLLPCHNKNNGCQETHFLNDVIFDHEKECMYRLVHCINNGNGCTEKVTFNNVIPHFEEKHAKYSGVPLRRQVSLRIVTNKSKVLSYDLPNAMININGSAFILKGRILNKRRYLWVYLLGSPNEAKNFSFTLKLYGGTVTAHYAGQVSSIDESFESLCVPEKCFSFDENEFKIQFQRLDGKYEYSLSIRNVKKLY